MAGWPARALEGQQQQHLGGNARALPLGDRSRGASARVLLPTEMPGRHNSCAGGWGRERGRASSGNGKDGGGGSAPRKKVMPGDNSGKERWEGQPGVGPLKLGRAGVWGGCILDGHHKGAAASEGLWRGPSQGERAAPETPN